MTNKASIELAFDTVKFFWPKFREESGFIFLDENFDPDAFSRLLKTVAPAKLEETINLTYLDDVFLGAGDSREIWEELGRYVCAMWVAKASAQFPLKKFVATFDWYDENASPGVTIMQVR
jgi:hypothetical protein